MARDGFDMCALTVLYGQRHAREIESADELEPLVAENVGKLRQRDSGLHRDAVVLDLQHAIHFRKIELGAAARGDAARHRAC